ncbi:MAG: hypothetical protein QOI11_400 [Candidatus Eremiobacteraeota bacterium]|jgi:hypothetical protein|nr:hypothetical protein [Candidatus Eremiobacteraeota bacterium]
MIEAMLKVAASLVAAAVVAVAAGAVAAPTPKPTAGPFVIGTFQPVPPAVSDAPFSSLPNIGRTRSVSPACATMRDLVIPSFEAALRADKRFAETRKRLPNYADIVGDPAHKDDAFRDSVLHELSRDASSLLEQALVLNKALGDPRISADVKDPQIVAERRQLEQLYVAQATRANLLNEFVMREQMTGATRGLEDQGAFRGKNQAPLPIPKPDTPIAQLTAPPGMPLRSAVSMTDKNLLGDWGTSLSVYVRQSENQAAKTFLPIAKSCR